MRTRDCSEKIHVLVDLDVFPVSGKSSSIEQDEFSKLWNLLKDSKFQGALTRKTGLALQLVTDSSPDTYGDVDEIFVKITLNQWKKYGNIIVIRNPASVSGLAGITVLTPAAFIERFSESSHADSNKLASKAANQGAHSYFSLKEFLRQNGFLENILEIYLGVIFALIIFRSETLAAFSEEVRCRRSGLGKTLTLMVPSSDKPQPLGAHQESDALDSSFSYVFNTTQPLSSLLSRSRQSNETTGVVGGATLFLADTAANGQAEGGRFSLSLASPEHTTVNNFKPVGFVFALASSTFLVSRAQQQASSSTEKTMARGKAGSTDSSFQQAVAAKGQGSEILATNSLNRSVDQGSTGAYQAVERASKNSLSSTDSALGTSDSTEKPSETVNTSNPEQPLTNDFQSNTQSNSTAAKFSSGVYTVGVTGSVQVNYLFDGGSYQGELGIFSLSGLDTYQTGSTEFIQEIVRRISSNSSFGRVIISDAIEGAQFSATLPWEVDFNAGTYLGTKTFSMRPGDQIGIALVADGTFQQVLNAPISSNQQQLLLSLATSGSRSALPGGQIADVNGKGHVFAMEDVNINGQSDRDYNDIVFQIDGLTGFTPTLNELINPARDWRTSTVGQAIMQIDLSSSQASLSSTTRIQGLDTLSVASGSTRFFMNTQSTSALEETNNPTTTFTQQGNSLITMQGTSSLGI